MNKVSLSRQLKTLGIEIDEFGNEDGMFTLKLIYLLVQYINDNDVKEWVERVHL